MTPSPGLPLRTPRDLDDWTQQQQQQQQQAAVFGNSNGTTSSGIGGGSNQPTPTSSWEQHHHHHHHHNHNRLDGGDGMPDGLIADWDIEGVAGWIASLGFARYKEALVDNVIDGEALVRLNHDDLRELGITSIGHRLSILKAVYTVKVAHDVPMDPDDYIPVSADDNEINKVATQQDIQRLIAIVKKRDARIVEAESHIQSLYEAMARLRNELLPVWRMVKNKNQELPPLSGDLSGGAKGGDADGDPLQMPPEPTPPPPPPPPPPSASSNLLQPAPTASKGLSRKFSMKKLILGTPKNASPTYPPAMPEYAYENMQPAPPGASCSNSNGNNHSTAVGLSNQPIIAPPTSTSAADGGHPSPTSPASTTIHHPSYNPHASLTTLSGRQQQQQLQHSQSSRATQQDRPDRQTPRTPHYADDDRGGGGGAANSEPDIFKSFRVSMDDPCRKVLPAALKRYNIQADWRQYALYIVHGDQERCLGLEEKPLILFKQLDREGRKPMFMLRRNAGGVATADGGGGPGGGGPGVGGGGGIQVPGGVL